MSIEISIVIPLYNKAEYIKRVLSCIENQTFTNWECTIIDDGSTDDSAKTVKEYISGRGDHWRYIYQENRGQAAARNTGINLSNGKYISFLDADDLWPRYKLESQFNAMESNTDYVLALSPFVIFGSHSTVPRVVRHTNSKKMLRGWLSMAGFGGAIESVGLIRRKTLGTELRFDEALTTSSGLDFTLQLIKLGEVLFLNDIGLFYRISEGQWHSNTAELERNLEIIRSKYQNHSSKQLLRYHLAYTYWAQMRFRGWRNYLNAFGKAIFFFNKVRTYMILCLLFRNIKARCLGFLKLKHITTLLTDID